MKRTFAFVMLVLAAAGCASRGATSRPGATESPALGGPVDETRLWRASLDVVGARFAIRSAQEATGRIETEFLVGPLSKTGFKSNAVKGEDAQYDSLHTIRRRAVVTVRPREIPAVAVEVDRERCVRAGYQEPLAPGVYSIDMTRGASDPNVTTLWVSEGRDGPLEEVIMREITARYSKLSRTGR